MFYEMLWDILKNSVNFKLFILLFLEAFPDFCSVWLCVCVCVCVYVCVLKNLGWDKREDMFLS